MEIAITRLNENDNKTEQSSSILNMDYFINNDSLNLGTIEEPKPAKKRGRPAKTKKMSDGNDMVVAEEKGKLSMTQSNESYHDMYDETTNLLKSTIIQVDTLNNDIKEQIDTIKASKTLKKKYDYLCDLTTASCSLIGTKINAIREINKTKTDANNLDLKRMKELKLNETNEDDDKAIMDMYNAYISTPIGSYGIQPPKLPTQTELTMAGVPNIVKTNIIDENGDIYDGRTLSSAENMMRLEHNKDVKTVVVFDQQTGSRWFDVVNLNTNQSIPNVEKPDPMFLETIDIDMTRGVARDTNLNRTYPLIVLNNSNMSEY